MLVDAVGIKPQQSEIADIFIISPAQITELMFHDPQQTPEYDQIFTPAPTPEQQDQAERDREMAVRVCWKPYMHDPRLPALLGRTRCPTRIVWGREDRIVPLECGELYQKAIPRLGPGGDRQLRPLSPDREARRVRQDCPGLPHLKEQYSRSRPYLRSSPPTALPGQPDDCVSGPP